MQRNVLNSPRLLELKKHRRRALWRKFFLSFFALFVVFIFLAYFSRLPSLNIQTVEISGNKVLESGLLKNTVEEEIAGKYLSIFPKSNIFYYSQNAIRNILQDKYKRISSVNFSVKENKILEVSVKEREAKFMWCGVDPSITASLPTADKKQDCYFLDENGYIFDQAPYFSGEVYFKFYGKTDRPTKEDTVGEPLGFYFSKQNFQELISFKDILVALGLKPVALFTGENENVEIFLSKGSSAATEPKVMLKINSDFQKLAENLQAALTTEPLQSEFANKYSKLQYIDLRFGNKVYYKFQ